MSSIRLRTKFLLSFLLISAGLTSATLWMVHRSVRIQLQKEIASDLRNSVSVFQDFQRQREIALSRSAELLASLPSLRSLMTTRDAATIQDESGEIWRLAPSDIFVLADPQGKVMGYRPPLQASLRAPRRTPEEFLSSDQPSFWWQSSGIFIRFFFSRSFWLAKIQPTRCALRQARNLESVALEVSKVATSQVAFFCGNPA